MRGSSLFVLLVIGLALYGVYTFYSERERQKETIEELREQLAQSEATIAQLRQQIDTLRPGGPGFAPSPMTAGGTDAGPTRIESISCPNCNGSGQIDNPNSASRITRITCPVCAGRGSAQLQLPADARICPQCGGFGKQMSSESAFGRSSSRSGSSLSRPRAVTCTRCAGRGWIR